MLKATKLEHNKTPPSLTNYLEARPETIIMQFGLHYKIRFAFKKQIFNLNLILWLIFFATSSQTSQLLDVDVRRAQSHSAATSLMALMSHLANFRICRQFWQPQEHCKFSSCIRIWWHSHTQLTQLIMLQVNVHGYKVRNFIASCLPLCKE